MDRFSFVMVLLSIIVGLGVTELLRNVARQIQHRSNVKSYWLHSLLVALMLIAFLQQWWEMWFLQSEEVWTFPVLLLMLGGPICLYIISHLMFPEDIDGTDLKTMYYEKHRSLYFIAALAVTFAVLFRPLSFGQDLLVKENLSSLGLLVAFLILSASKNPRAHAVIVPVIMTALVIDILTFSMRLS